MIKRNRTIIREIRKKRGFTLVEVLLIVSFTSLAFLGVYMMQQKASEEVVVSNEKEYILTLFDQIDKSAASISKFENISLQALKDSGYQMKAVGYTLASVTSPTPTRLEAQYTGLTNKECSMFVSSMVNFSDTHSARINNINIASKANPEQITMECSNGDNNVVIIRENNTFGVALNTTPNGTNNPIGSSPTNPCPTGVCNVISITPPTPFTPIVVGVTKPPFTPFTPGVNPAFQTSPMPQPPTSPPVLTLPPPAPAPVTPPGPVPPPAPVPPAPPAPAPTPAGPATPVPSPPPPASCTGQGYYNYVTFDYCTRKAPYLTNPNAPSWSIAGFSTTIQPPHDPDRAYPVLASEWYNCTSDPTQPPEDPAAVAWRTARNQETRDAWCQ